MQVLVEQISILVTMAQVTDRQMTARVTVIMCPVHTQPGYILVEWQCKPQHILMTYSQMKSVRYHNIQIATLVTMTQVTEGQLTARVTVILSPVYTQPGYKNICFIHS